LDILLSYSKVKVKVKKDPKRMRPNDIPVFIGDCTKLKRLTGWRPRIHFQQTLKDLLNYWRDNIR
jgi:GDP-4-dehydro-6-deoxy-D-mannose reductase